MNGLCMWCGAWVERGDKETERSVFLCLGKGISNF